MQGWTHWASKGRREKRKEQKKERKKGGESERQRDWLKGHTHTNIHIFS